MNIKIGLTGGSGNMGVEALKQFLELEFIDKINLLLRNKKRNHSFAKKLKKQYPNKINVIYGNIENQDDCLKLVEGTSYIFHLAALIPPMADHNFEQTDLTNNVGVKNLLRAIEKQKNQPKLIHISTVGIYGNRDYHHPWGRVGDPLLPSPYDVYSITKLKGERAVLESNVKSWVILRQTGVLHKNLLKDNISDGLLFHTPYNVPIEWVTAEDSGVLLRNILVQDYKQTIDEKFWKKVYNIGGGELNRVTGYETFQEGFGVMGVSVEEFMKPNWNATRNFHCMWFLDSHILNDYFNFQSQSLHSFWEDILNSHKYFKLAKIISPKLLSKLVLGPLLKDENAPYYWVKNELTPRVIAVFGSVEQYNSLPETWDNFPVLAKGRTPDNEIIDYNELKDISHAEKYLLNHGYDENKKDEDIDIDDLREAALFRGGKLISTSMVKGDLYTPLEWESHSGRRFILSPYAVIKAGHWDAIQELPEPWNYDELAKTNPFYAQIWYDTHSENEENRYYFDGDVAKIKQKEI